MVFSTLLNPSGTISNIIVPNQGRFLQQNQINDHHQQAEQMRLARNGEIIHPRTGDNIEIDGIFFHGIDPNTHQAIPRNEQTVIIFGGLGSYHYHYAYLVDMFRERGLNVAIFNLRWVGKQLNEDPTPEKIIEDGLSVVDYIHHHHQVPYSKIILLGSSLGGGPSSIVASLRPDVSTISERSYKQLSAASTHFIRMTNSAFAYFASFAPTAMRTFGWDFNAEESWKKISGKKCLVYHPDDEIIAKEASLFSAIYGNDQNTIFIELNKEIPGSPHMRGLTPFEVDAIVRAVKIIPTPQPQSNQTQPQPQFELQQAINQIQPQSQFEPQQPINQIQPQSQLPQIHQQQLNNHVHTQPVQQVPEQQPTPATSVNTPSIPHVQNVNDQQTEAKRQRWDKIKRIAYDIFSVIFFPLGIYRLIQHFKAKRVVNLSQS